MITIKNESIFNTKANFIINPVNCVGVMGAGLAKQFKTNYFEYFSFYQMLCYKKEIKLNRVYIHYEKQYRPQTYFISFPTKNHWQEKSNLLNIEGGLIDLKAKINLPNWSVAIPPIGCGLGGLNKNDVFDLLKFHFENSELMVEYYDYE